MTVAIMSQSSAVGLPSDCPNLKNAGDEAFGVQSIQ
jgi:hypothetical protein